MRHRLRILAALLAASLAALPALAEEPPPERTAGELMDAVMWNKEPIGGPFKLTDHTGRVRTDADFHGRLMLIYFGFTYCPDICPTDAMAMGQAMDLLGKAGEAVQPLFITVDPERDTVKQLADYMPMFHERLIGLTGTPEEIRAVARDFRVYYRKAPFGKDDYTVDHMGFMYLMDREGKYIGYVPPGTSAPRLAAILEPLLTPAPEKKP